MNLHRNVLALGLAVALLLSAANTARADITGEYRVRGTNPDGSTYSGAALIERDGDVYAIVWTIGNYSFGGIGIVHDDVFSVAWVRDDGDLYGLAAYTIDDDALRGTWTMNDHTSVYTETLTPR